ncbi:hypothetical protein EMIT0P294_40105 [Pseudomonas sp. IT-P294]
MLRVRFFWYYESASADDSGRREIAITGTLLNDLSRGEKKGGESICKPGSVLNSHSSTMAITGHL